MTSLCQTCMHFIIVDDHLDVLCHRHVPNVGARDSCSEYRLDPATEPPPDDEEPPSTEW